MDERERRLELYNQLSAKERVGEYDFDELDSSRQKKLFEAMKADEPDLIPEPDFATFQQKYFADINSNPIKKQRLSLYNKLSAKERVGEYDFDELDSSRQKKLFEAMKANEPDLIPEKDFTAFQQKYFADIKKKAGGGDSENGAPNVSRQRSGGFFDAVKENPDILLPNAGWVYDAVKGWTNPDPNRRDKPTSIPQKEYSDVAPDATKRRVNNGLFYTGEHTAAYQEKITPILVENELQRYQKEKNLVAERVKNGTLKKDTAAEIEKALLKEHETKLNMAQTTNDANLYKATDQEIQNKISQEQDKIDFKFEEQKPSDAEQKAKQFVENYIDTKKREKNWQKGSDFSLSASEIEDLNKEIKNKFRDATKIVAQDYAKAAVQKREDVTQIVDDFFLSSQRSKVPSAALSSEMNDVVARHLSGKKVSPEKIKELNRQQDAAIKEYVTKTEGKGVLAYMNKQDIQDLKKQIQEKHPDLSENEIQESNAYIRNIADNRNQEIYKAHRVETEIKALGLPNYEQIDKAQKIASAELQEKYKTDMAPLYNQSSAEIVKHGNDYESGAKLVVENAQKNISNEKTKADAAVANIQSLYGQGKITDVQANEQIKGIIGGFNQYQQKVSDEAKAQNNDLYKQFTTNVSKAQADILKAQNDNMGKLKNQAQADYQALLAKQGITAEKMDKLKILQKQFDLEDKVLNDVIAHRKWESQSFFENGSQTLLRGLQGVYMPIYDLVEYLNPDEKIFGIDTSEAFMEGMAMEQDAAQRGKRNFGEFSWGNMLSPDYLVTQAVEQAPQFLMFRGMGKIGMTAGAAFARAIPSAILKLGSNGLTKAVIPVMTNPTVQRAISFSVGAGSMRVAESQMIAAGVYKNLLNQGHTAEYAADKAKGVFNETMPLLAMDALELFNSYSKSSIFNITKKGLFNTAKTQAVKGGYTAAGLKIATDFGQEGFDELYQGLSEHNAMNPLNIMNLGQFFSSTQGQETFALGGLVSGGTSIAASASKLLNSRDSSARGQLLGNNRYSMQDQVERFNENMEKFFSNMASEEISPDMLKSRLFQLQASLETLRERGLIDDQEWTTATRHINTQSAIYDQYHQGLLGNMQLNSHSMQEYAVNLSELEMVNLQIKANGQGEKNSGDAMNSAALEARRSQLQGNIKALLTDTEGKPLYRISENGNFTNYSTPQEFNAAIVANGTDLRSGKKTFYTNDEKLNKTTSEKLGIKSKAESLYNPPLPNENLQIAQNFIDAALPLAVLDNLEQSINNDENLSKSDKKSRVKEIVQETSDKNGKNLDIDEEKLTQFENQATAEIGLLLKSISAQTQQEAINAANDILFLKQNIESGASVDFFPNDWSNKQLRIAKLFKMIDGLGQMKKAITEEKENNTNPIENTAMDKDAEQKDATTTVPIDAKLEKLKANVKIAQEELANQQQQEKSDLSELMIQVSQKELKKAKEELDTYLTENPNADETIQSQGIDDSQNTQPSQNENEKGAINTIPIDVELEKLKAIVKEDEGKLAEYQQQKAESKSDEDIKQAETLIKARQTRLQESKEKLHQYIAENPNTDKIIQNEEIDDKQDAQAENEKVAQDEKEKDEQDEKYEKDFQKMQQEEDEKELELLIQEEERFNAMLAGEKKEIDAIKDEIFGSENDQEIYKNIMKQISDNDFITIGKILSEINRLKKGGALTIQQISENENLIISILKSFIDTTNSIFDKIDTSKLSDQENLLLNALKNETEQKITRLIDPSNVLFKNKQGREEKKKKEEEKIIASKKKEEEMKAEIAAVNKKIADQTAQTQAAEQATIAAYRVKHAVGIAKFVADVKSGKSKETAKKDFNRIPTNPNPLVPVQLLDAVLAEAYGELMQFYAEQAKMAAEKLATSGQSQESVFETEKQEGNLSIETSETLEMTEKQKDTLEEAQKKKNAEEIKKEVASGKRVRIVLENIAGKLARVAKKFFRQTEAIIKKVAGAVTTVYFSKKSSVKNPKARYVVMELEQVQASDVLVSGTLSPNPLFFLNEGQPKKRGQNDANSILTNPDNFNPNLVMQGEIAYSGAPVVNQRGESIQGTGRIARIKQYYQSRKDGGAYRAYLLKNAAIYGLNAADILGFKQPILVRMVEGINDSVAITFGNYTVSDMEDKGKLFTEALSAIMKNKFDSRNQISNSYTAAKKLFIELIEKFKNQENSSFDAFVNNNIEEFLKVAQMLDKDSSFITEQDATNILNGKSLDSLEKLKRFFRYVFYSHSAQEIADLLDSNLFKTLPTVEGAKSRNATVDFDESGLLQLLAFTQSNSQNQNPNYSPIQPILAEAIIVFSGFLENLKANPLKANEIKQIIVNENLQNQGVQALQNRFEEYLSGGVFAENGDALQIHPLAKQFISALLVISGTNYYASISNDNQVERAKGDLGTAVRKFAIQLVENLSNNQKQSQQSMFEVATIKTDAEVFLETLNQFISSAYNKDDKGVQKGYHSFNAAGTKNQARTFNFFIPTINPFLPPNKITEILEKIKQYEQSEEQQRAEAEAIERTATIAKKSVTGAETTNIPAASEKTTSDSSTNPENTGEVGGIRKREITLGETLAVGDKTEITQQALVIDANFDNLPPVNAHDLAMQNNAELVEDKTLTSGEAVQLNEMSADLATEKIDQDDKFSDEEKITQKTVIVADTALANAQALDSTNDTKEAIITLDEGINALKKIIDENVAAKSEKKQKKTIANTKETVPAEPVVPKDATDADILKDRVLIINGLKKLGYSELEAAKMVESALSLGQQKIIKQQDKVNYAVVNEVWKKSQQKNTPAKKQIEKIAALNIGKQENLKSAGADTGEKKTQSKKKTNAELRIEAKAEFDKLRKSIGKNLTSGGDLGLAVQIITSATKIAYFTIAEKIDSFFADQSNKIVGDLAKVKQTEKANFLTAIKESNLDDSKGIFKDIDWSMYYDEQWEMPLESIGGKYNIVNGIKSLEYANKEMTKEMRSQKFTSLQDFLDKLSILQADAELGINKTEERAARFESIKNGAENRALIPVTEKQAAPVARYPTENVENDIPKPTIQYTQSPTGLPEGLVYVKPEFYEDQFDEHQQYGINLAMTAFFKNNKKAFVMADNMGVGKTRQMLVIANEYAARTGKKVLIVSESTTIWENAFKKDAESLGVDLDIFEFRTYDSLHKAPREVGLVIFDEAQNLKNPNKAFDAKNSIKYDNVIYASATPADKIGGFLYFVPDLIGKTTDELAYELGVIRSPREFKDKVVQEWKSDGRVPYQKQVEILNNYIQKAMSEGQMVRREYPFWGKIVYSNLTADKELESQIAAIRMIFDSRRQKVRPNKQGFFDQLKRKTYTNYAGQRQRADKPEYKGKTPEQMAALDDAAIRELNEAQITEIDKVTEIWKAKYVAQQIAADLAEGKSVVVASQYVKGLEVLDYEAIMDNFALPEEKQNKSITTSTKKEAKSFLLVLKEELEKRNIPFGEITGDTKEYQARIIEDFTNSETPQVIIGSLASMSAGISLDAQKENAPQRVMYIASTSYSADQFEQIQGRVSRKSSKRSAEIRIMRATTTQDLARNQKVDAKIELLSVSQGLGVSQKLESDFVQKQERPNDNPLVEERAKTNSVVGIAVAPIGTLVAPIGTEGNAQGLIFGKNNENVLIQASNPSADLLAKLKELGAVKGEARDNAGNFIGEGWIIPLKTLADAGTKIANDLAKIINLDAQKKEANQSEITIRKDDNLIRVYGAKDFIGNTLLAMGAVESIEQGKTVYNFKFTEETKINYNDIAKRLGNLAAAANNYLEELKAATKSGKDVSSQAFIEGNTKRQTDSKVWVVKGLNAESLGKLASITNLKITAQENGTHNLEFDVKGADKILTNKVADTINEIIREQNKKTLAATKQTFEQQAKSRQFLQTSNNAKNNGAIGSAEPNSANSKAEIINGEVVQTEQEKIEQKHQQNLGKTIVDLSIDLESGMSFSQALSRVPQTLKSDVLSILRPRVGLADNFSQDPQRPPKAKRVTEIIQGILNYTKNITVKFGKKLSKYTLGKYAFGSSQIQLRKKGDIDTFMHEFGHALDDTLQLYTNEDAIKTELQALSVFGSQPPRDATPEFKEEYELREGIAEFIRGYFVNPEAMKTQAPNFYNRLLVKSATFKNMTNGQVDMMELLDDAGNDIRILYNTAEKDGLQATKDKMVAPEKFDEKRNVLQKVRDWVQRNSYIYGKKPNIKQQIWALTTDFWEQSIAPMGVMLFGTKAGKADKYAEKILKIIEGDNSQKSKFDELYSPTKRFSILYRLNFSIHGKINEYLQNGVEDYTMRKELEIMEYAPIDKKRLEKGATLVYRSILADAKNNAKLSGKTLKEEFENLVVAQKYTAYQTKTMIHLFENPTSNSVAAARIFDEQTGQTVNLKFLFEKLGHLVGEGNADKNDLWVKEMGNVSAFMILERSLELAMRYAKNNPTLPIPLSILPYQLTGAYVSKDFSVIQRLKDDITAFKEQAGDKFVHYEESARRYRVFANSILKYMMNKGRITAQQYKDITDNNTQYVSFARIHQETMNGNGDAIINMDFGQNGSTTETLKKINPDGSFADWNNNPFSNLLETTYRNIMETDRNETVRSFVDTFKAAYDMGGNRAKKVTNDDEIDAQDLDISTAITPLFEENLTDEQRNNSALQEKENILVYYDENGNKKFLQFNDPDLYQSVKSLGKIAARFENIANPIVKAFVKVFGFIGRATRAMYVLSPSAIINNSKRAQTQTFLNSRTHGNAVEQMWDFAKMILNTLNPLPLATQFLPEKIKGKLPKWLISDKKNLEAGMQSLARLGGDQSKFYLANIEDGYNMNALSAIKMLVSENKIVPFSVPTNLGDAKKTAGRLFNNIKSSYGFYIDKLENADRVKEFDRAYMYAIDKLGMTDFQAQNYAAYQARDLMDYAQMSELMYVVNQLYFFSNASLRGIIRTFGEWKHKPLEKIMRLTMISAFTLISPLLFMAIGEDEYEAFEAQAGYKKHYFILLPTPWGGSEYIHLPMPHETAVLTNLPQRLLAMAMGKETAWDDYSSSIARTTLGIFGKDIIPSLFQPIRDVANNYSEFRKKEIVYQAHLDIALQDKKAAAFSRLLSAPFGSNPKYADYLIEGYGGAWGKALLDMSDFLVGDSRQRGSALDIEGTPSWLDFMIDQTGMVKEKTVFSIKALNDNFQTAKLFNMQKHPTMQKLKTMSEEYAALKKGGLQEKAADLYIEIIKKSLSLRAVWDNSASNFANWQVSNPEASQLELVKAKNKFFGIVDK
jgi:ddrB-like ParB superfamily domain/Large polyvalent protein associated domain 38